MVVICERDEKKEKKWVSWEWPERDGCVCEREGKDRYRWEEGFKKLSNIFEIQTNGSE